MDVFGSGISLHSYLRVKHIRSEPSFGGSYQVGSFLANQMPNLPNPTSDTYVVGGEMQ